LTGHLTINHLPPADLAGLAVKTYPPRMRLAVKRQEIITQFNGLVEAVGMAEAGDIIATGRAGEEWIIKRSDFTALYGDWHGPGKYRPMPTPRRFFLIHDTVDIQTSWGGQHIAGSLAQPGAIIIHNNSIHGVTPGLFPLDYKINQLPGVTPIRHLNKSNYSSSADI
jgi:hypothetical protein